jgi:N-succinyldiaminopimelate aminotransferase
MNPGLALLQPYPFQKLRALTEGVKAADKPAIALTIGEPQHAAPASVIANLAVALEGINKYPATNGSLPLRSAIANWLQKRFHLEEVDPNRHVLPVNGTREALFAIAQTLVTPGQSGAVISPNPFYQIYEGAALLAGTSPVFVPAGPSTQFLPDFTGLTEDDWHRCQLLYICTPGNPSGAVIPKQALQHLITLAETYRFTIVSDECYSEIYPVEGKPPCGLLEAAADMGYHDFRHCLVFHSLSKRSNLPGLRSGFVAGDANLIATFLQYRTYHGCAMPPHHQAASLAAWQDETHVQDNRTLYRQKFNDVLPILQPVLPVTRPEAGFYLWPETPLDDEQFTVELLRHTNVAVLPGRYLGREVAGYNPGMNRVRMALVADHAECVEAAERIRYFLSKG